MEAEFKYKDIRQYPAIISLVDVDDESKCIYTSRIYLYDEKMGMNRNGINMIDVTKLFINQYNTIEKVCTLFDSEFKICKTDELISLIDRKEYPFVYQFFNNDGAWYWRVFLNNEWKYLSDVLGDKPYEMPRLFKDGLPKLSPCEIIRLENDDSGVIVKIDLYHNRRFYLLIRLSDYNMITLYDEDIKSYAYSKEKRIIMPDTLFMEVCEKAFNLTKSNESTARNTQ